MHIQQKSNHLKLFELYKKFDQSDLIVNPLWKFDDVNGWTELDSRFIWSRRRDMSGAHMKVALQFNTTLIKKTNEVCNRVNDFDSFNCQCHSFCPQICSLPFSIAFIDGSLSVTV